MNSKLKFQINYSLKKKFKSKWFIVVNCILLVLIPIICNIDSIIKVFGGDFDDPTNVYVVDNANMYNEFLESYKSSNISPTNSEVKIENSYETLENLKQNIIKSKSKDIIIVSSLDKENIYSIKFISYDLIDTILYQNLVSALDSAKREIALGKSNINTELLAWANKNVQVNRIVLNETANTNSELMKLVGSVLIPVFIIPFFFLIIMSVQYVGAEINEEKTSKSMEIIISSVSPISHFLAKIISTNIFVLTQGVLMLLYGFIGIISRTLVTGQTFTTSFDGEISELINTFVTSGMLNNLLIAVPFVIILLVLSFVVYSLIAGILASVTTNAEDYQQIQTPLMLVMIFGYYLAIIASTIESSSFIKVASFIPLISSILSPVLLVQGQIGIPEMLISIFLMIILIAILIKYGIRIYKVGILNYSSKGLWKKMFSAAKTK